MLQANVAIASKRPLIRNLNAHKKKRSLYLRDISNCEIYTVHVYEKL